MSTRLCYDWASRSEIPDIHRDLQRVEALRKSKKNSIWLYKLEALVNGMLEFVGMLGAITEGVYNVKAFSRTISPSLGSNEFGVPVLVWLQDEICLHIGLAEHRYILFFQLNGSTPKDGTGDMWKYSRANLRLYNCMFRSTERPRTIYIGDSLECIIKFSEGPAFVRSGYDTEHLEFGSHGGGFVLVPREGHSLQNLLSGVVADFVMNRGGSAVATEGTYEDSMVLRQNSKGPSVPSFVRVGGFISLESLVPKDIFDPEKVYECAARGTAPVRCESTHVRTSLQKKMTLPSQETQNRTLPPQCTMHEGSYRRLVNSCVREVNLVPLFDRLFDLACDRHSTGEIVSAILAIRGCRGDVKFRRGCLRRACVLCAVNTTSRASKALIYSRTMAGPVHSFESNAVDVEDTWCDRYAGGVVYLACADMWADVEKQIFRDSRKEITVDPSVERLFREYWTFEPTYWLSYELHFSGIEFEGNRIHCSDRAALSHNTAKGYRWLMSVMKAYNTIRRSITLQFDESDLNKGGSVLGCILVTKSKLRAIDVAFWIDLWNRSGNSWEGVARRGGMEATIERSLVEMVGSSTRWILYLEDSGNQRVGHVVRLDKFTTSPKLF